MTLSLSHDSCGQRIRLYRLSIFGEKYELTEMLLYKML